MTNSFDFSCYLLTLSNFYCIDLITILLTFSVIARCVAEI